MRVSAPLRGKSFGNLMTTVRGTAVYRLSPFELRAFAGFFSRGLPNMLWRFRNASAKVVPPLALGYMVYVVVDKEHDRLQRKQPGEFDDET